jgi:hypothetical protein
MRGRATTIQQVSYKANLGFRNF